MVYLAQVKQKSIAMNDADIRISLVEYLSKRKAFSASRLLEEVSLQNGLVRADLVYCSNRLECFEIKSHNDTLKRLVSQGWQYEQSFDLVTLVCASKHLSQAINIVPEWWGVLEVTREGALQSWRRSMSNPNIGVAGMVDLLTNDESRAFLSAIGHGEGASRLSHSQLKMRIQAVTTMPILRRWILDALQERKDGWRPRASAEYQGARLCG